MKRRPQKEQGIALITTLIMLSLVTFLSVAFLTLTRQERQTVAVLGDIVMAEEMEVDVDVRAALSSGLAPHVFYV